MTEKLRKILDCTLRDGGYQNNWQFSNKFVQKYLNLMDSKIISCVELGIRSDQIVTDSGALRTCTKKNLENLYLDEQQSFSVIVNLKEFLDKPLIDFEKLIKETDKRIQIIRLTATVQNIGILSPFIDIIKKYDFQISLNLMQASLWSYIDLHELAVSLNSLPLDIENIADSFGGLDTNMVIKIVTAFSNVIGVPLGIHAHDNQGLALINSLSASANGCEWIDVTINGMGRGAGNVATERLLFGCKATKFSSKIHKFIDEEILPLKRKTTWGPSYLYFISGKYNLHPHYVSGLDEYEISYYDKISCLLLLGENGVNKFTDKLLNSVVEQVRSGK